MGLTHTHNIGMGLTHTHNTWMGLAHTYNIGMGPTHINNMGMCLTHAHIMGMEICQERLRKPKEISNLYSRHPWEGGKGNSNPNTSVERYRITQLKSHSSYEIRTNSFMHSFLVWKVLIYSSHHHETAVLHIAMHVSLGMHHMYNRIPLNLHISALK
jgi:hypothetical protein